jgi:hypothetical protein
LLWEGAWREPESYARPDQDSTPPVTYGEAQSGSPPTWSHSRGIVVLGRTLQPLPQILYNHACTYTRSKLPTSLQVVRLFPIPIEEYASRTKLTRLTLCHCHCTCTMWKESYETVVFGLGCGVAGPTIAILRCRDGRPQCETDMFL